eukprot:5451401-Ditylum_brightwellii.AAC.1
MDQQPTLRKIKRYSEERARSETREHWSEMERSFYECMARYDAGAKDVCKRKKCLKAVYPEAIYLSDCS